MSRQGWRPARAQHLGLSRRGDSPGLFENPTGAIRVTSSPLLLHPPNHILQARVCASSFPRRAVAQSRRPRRGAIPPTREVGWRLEGRQCTEAKQVGAGLGARDFHVWLYQAASGVLSAQLQVTERPVGKA